MPGRGPQTFKKRQKEQQRKEKQEEKMAKRLAKKQGMPSEPGISDEDLDFTDNDSPLDEEDKADSAGGFAA
jgi:hypothetical protein